MDEFDEKEELYNPAAPQYQNRAERQRGIMDRIVAEGREQEHRRRDYIERWSYNFDLATYDAISDAVRHAENPADEMHEILAATSISKLFNVPVQEARANSEYYRNLLYPNVERYQIPKTWDEGAEDSFKLGTNGIALDYYGYQLAVAEFFGKPVDGILKKMNEIEAENEKLAANMPTGWGNRLLQFGARATPYTGMLIGIAGLAAFAAPALGIGAGAGALGASATGAAAAATAWGTSVSSATAAGLGTGSVYASLRKAGFDKNISLAVSLPGGIAIGAVNGVIGTVAGNLGNTPQGAIEKAAATAAKNLMVRLGASPYGKALAARTAGVLTDYALEGFGEALEEGAENAIAEVSHFVAAALHNSRERNAEAKFEEVFNRVTGQWESYFREAMADEKIPYHTAEEIIENVRESIIGGFKGGLLFGVVGAFRNGAAPLAEYKAVMAAARVSKTVEEFGERIGGSAILKDMEEKDKPGTITAIYENERRPLAEMEKGKQAELEETRYFGEDAEAAEYGEAVQDEETGGADLPEAAREKGPEYRENGELKTRDTTSEEDGVTSGRYAALSEDGKVYGEIRYTERDGAVEVDGVRMAEGRENLRPELWAEFNRYYEGRTSHGTRARTRQRKSRTKWPRSRPKKSALRTQW
jgi:hypothetical protein